MASTEMDDEFLEMLGMKPDPPIALPALSAAPTAAAAAPAVAPASVSPPVTSAVATTAAATTALPVEPTVAVATLAAAAVTAPDTKAPPASAAVVAPLPVTPAPAAAAAAAAGALSSTITAPAPERSPSPPASAFADDATDELALAPTSAPPVTVVAAAIPPPAAVATPLPAAPLIPSRTTTPSLPVPNAALVVPAATNVTPAAVLPVARVLLPTATAATAPPARAPFFSMADSAAPGGTLMDDFTHFSVDEHLAPPNPTAASIASPAVAAPNRHAGTPPPAAAASVIQTASGVSGSALDLPVPDAVESDFISAANDSMASPDQSSRDRAHSRSAIGGGGDDWNADRTNTSNAADEDEPAQPNDSRDEPHAAAAANDIALPSVGGVYRLSPPGAVDTGAAAAKRTAAKPNSKRTTATAPPATRATREPGAVTVSRSFVDSKHSAAAPPAAAAAVAAQSPSARVTPRTPRRPRPSARAVSAAFDDPNAGAPFTQKSCGAILLSIVLSVPFQLLFILVWMSRVSTNYEWAGFRSELVTDCTRPPALNASSFDTCGGIPNQFSRFIMLHLDGVPYETALASGPLHYLPAEHTHAYTIAALASGGRDGIDSVRSQTDAILTGRSPAASNSYDASTSATASDNFLYQFATFGAGNLTFRGPNHPLLDGWTEDTIRSTFTDSVTEDSADTTDGRYQTMFYDLFTCCDPNSGGDGSAVSARASARAVLDRYAHAESNPILSSRYWTLAAPTTPAAAAAVLTKFGKQFRAIRDWVDSNPAYLLVILSTNAIPAVSGDASTSFLALYNPTLNAPPASTPTLASASDIAATLFVYLSKINVPYGSIGSAVPALQTRFGGDAASSSAALKLSVRNAEQLRTLAAARGVLATNSADALTAAVASLSPVPPSDLKPVWDSVSAFILDASTALADITAGSVGAIVFLMFLAVTFQVVAIRQFWGGVKPFTVALLRSGLVGCTLTAFPLLFVYGLSALYSSTAPIAHPGLTRTAAFVTFPICLALAVYTIGQGTATASKAAAGSERRHSVSSGQRPLQPPQSIPSPVSNGASGGTSGSAAGFASTKVGVPNGSAAAPASIRRHVIGDDFAGGDDGDDDFAPRDPIPATATPVASSAVTGRASSDHANAMIEMHRFEDLSGPAVPRRTPTASVTSAPATKPAVVSPSAANARATSPVPAAASGGAKNQKPAASAAAITGTPPVVLSALKPAAARLLAAATAAAAAPKPALAAVKKLAPEVATTATAATNAKPKPKAKSDLSGGKPAAAAPTAIASPASKPAAVTSRAADASARPVPPGNLARLKPPASVLASLPPVPVPVSPPAAAVAKPAAATRPAAIRAPAPTVVAPAPTPAPKPAADPFEFDDDFNPHAASPPAGSSVFGPAGPKYQAAPMHQPVAAPPRNAAAAAAVDSVEPVHITVAPAASASSPRSLAGSASGSSQSVSDARLRVRVLFRVVGLLILQVMIWAWAASGVDSTGTELGVRTVTWLLVAVLYGGRMYRAATAIDCCNRNPSADDSNSPNSANPNRVLHFMHAIDVVLYLPFLLGIVITEFQTPQSTTTALTYPCMAVLLVHVLTIMWLPPAPITSNAGSGGGGAEGLYPLVSLLLFVAGSSPGLAAVNSRLVFVWAVIQFDAISRVLSEPVLALDPVVLSENQQLEAVSVSPSDVDDAPAGSGCLTDCQSRLFAYRSLSPLASPLFRISVWTVLSGALFWRALIESNHNDPNDQSTAAWIAFMRRYRFELLVPFVLLRLSTRQPSTASGSSVSHSGDSGEDDSDEAAGDDTTGWPSIDQILSTQRESVWSLLRLWWLVAMLCYEFAAYRFAVPLPASYGFVIGGGVMTIGFGGLIAVAMASAAIADKYASILANRAAAAAGSPNQSSGGGRRYHTPSAAASAALSLSARSPAAESAASASGGFSCPNCCPCFGGRSGTRRYATVDDGIDSEADSW